MTTDLDKQSFRRGARLGRPVNHSRWFVSCPPTRSSFSKGRDVDRSNEEWFHCEKFWEEMYPFMFSETRFVAAVDDVPKIAALSGISTGSLLDLACGPGRYAIPFARAGYSVTGVDCTSYLLRKARDLAMRAEVSVEWVEQDMREFLRPATFDLAINLFTSFGYFDEEADNRRVLENLYASLKPGGVFVFDHLGKEVLAAKLQPTLSEALPDGRLLVQRVSVIDDWSRIEGEWIVVGENGRSSFHNRHWLYSGQEIRGLLSSVGFAEVSLYGSLGMTPYGPQAQRLVAVARKAQS